MRKDVEVRCHDVIGTFFRHMGMSEVTENDHEETYRNLTPGIFERQTY
jgi:hypothetical protein